MVCDRDEWRREERESVKATVNYAVETMVKVDDEAMAACALSGRQEKEDGVTRQSRAKAC